MRTPLSIRVIYYLTQVVFGLSLLLAVVVLVFNVAVFVGFFDNNMQLHVDFPIEIDFPETGTYTIKGEVYHIQLVAAHAKAHLVDTPIIITRSVAVLLLLLVAGLVYGMVVFRNFISRVNEGDIFNHENILRLKTISYILIGFWLMLTIYKAVVVKLIAASVTFRTLNFTGHSNVNGSLLVLALFIWVLSHIFATGAKLNEENKLTI